MARTPAIARIRGQLPFSAAGEGVVIAIPTSMLIELESEASEPDKWVVEAMERFRTLSPAAMDDRLRRMVFKDGQPAGIGLDDVDIPLADLATLMVDCLMCSLHGKTLAEYRQHLNEQGGSPLEPEIEPKPEPEELDPSSET